MEYPFLHTTSYGTPCPECKKVSFEISLNHLLKYYLKEDMICPECKTKLNWWDLLIRHFDWGFPGYLFAIVGGLNTSFFITMKPNKTFRLDLEKKGIPINSKIISINYTPNGSGLFPIEIHGNTPIRHFIPNKIMLFGNPIGKPEPETKIAISVIWVPDLENNTIWSNLVESIEAFSLSKYNNSIIPANVAVESKLNQILNEHLRKFSSSENVAKFLTDGATYSHQLNVLLPLIVNYENFPPLPVHIRGGLNGLRSYRNKIAHKGGVTKNPLDKAKTGSLLCSAFFALGYLNLLEQRIKK